MAHTPHAERNKIWYLLAFFVGITTCLAAAQSQQLKTSVLNVVPSFAIISIHEHRGADDGWKYDYPANGFVGHAIPLNELFKEAYGIFDDNRIEAMPSWATRKNYDIVAKVSDDDLDSLHRLSLEERRQMLRKMLAQRFNLRVHEIERVLPIYLMKVDTKGSKLRESNLPMTPNAIQGIDGVIKQSQPGVLVVERFSMRDLANTLTWDVGRPVIDNTGLKKRYDFSLHWSPQMQSAGAASDGPSIFTALQEQLGLKLEASKRAMNVLFVDSLGAPTEN